MEAHEDEDLEADPARPAPLAAPLAEPPVEPDLVLMLSAQRWTGYGRDRLYISSSGGLRIGWLNLITGDRVITVDDRRIAEIAVLLHVCIDDWLDDPDNQPDRRGWSVTETETETAEEADVAAEAGVDDETIDLRDGAPIRAFLARRRRRLQFRA